MDLRKDELYRELNESLEGLVKHYRQLLELVRKEKDILVGAKLDELNDNNKAKDGMLVRIRSLENTRMKVARELAQKIGVDVEAPRLLDMATRFDGERSDKLRTLHATLDLLVKRVSDVNKQNEELVQAALNNITGAMEAIRDTLQEKPTYAKQGAMAAAPSSAAGRLVSREA
jgi:hypothetical protein